MPHALQAEGVIFDFDGVILLSEEHHLAAWTKAAAAAGCALPSGFLERGLGASDNDLAREVAQNAGATFTTSWILDQKRAIYLAHLSTKMTLVPGILAALEFLHLLLPLGLATSSSRLDIAPVMERCGLGRYFSVVSTIEDVERPKPDPEIYLKTAKAMGCRPSGVFVFEDSKQGIGAALAAGMQVIALTTAYPREELPEVAAYVPDFLGLAAIADLMGFHFRREIC